MKRQLSHLPLSLVVGSFLLATQAQSATVIFSDKGLFLSSVAPGAYEETFTGAAGLTVVQNFSAGVPTAFTYNVTAAPAAGFTIYRNGSLLSNATANSVLTVTITSGNVYGIGGNFFKTNDSDALKVGSPVTITLNDGTTTTVNPTSVSDFVGFVSDTPITSLSISATSPLYSSIDNLVVAAPIPEPTALALLGTGLILVLGRRQARKS